MAEEEPPYSIEAEQATIGAILFDNKAMDIVVEIVKSPDYFYVPRHSKLYKTILELYYDSKPIDIVLLGEAADVESWYIIQLLDDTATAQNIKYHAQIVADKYKLRNIIFDCSEIVSKSSQRGATCQDVLGQMESMIEKFHEREIIEAVPIGELVVDYVAQLLDKNRIPSVLLETRIASLNHIIGGLSKGDMTIIAGPTSMGKSSLALDIVLMNCAKELHSSYFAIDERAAAMAQRVLTRETGIDTRPRLHQSFSEHEQDMLTQVGVDMANQGYLRILANADITVQDIRAQCRRIQRKHGLDCIVVDYIQQLRPYRKFESRALEVGENSRILKVLAKELDIAVIVISQLNRDISTQVINPQKKQWGYPRLSQLRDSGMLEQDANLVLFVWNIRRAMHDRGMSKYEILTKGGSEIVRSDGSEMAFIVVAKNKLGPTGAIECIWNPKKMIFYSETSQEYVEEYPEETMVLF